MKKGDRRWNEEGKRRDQEVEDKISKAEEG
jgi:hypothetical protein